MKSIKNKEIFLEGGNPDLDNPIEVEDDCGGSTIITNKVQLGLIVFGLLLTIFIGALDESIVATALDGIAQDFRSQGEVTWIGGGYLLTTTAFTPLYGKLSDIFGRKPTLLFALLIFLSGSIFAAVSPNMISLIVFRSLSGIGAGGLISLPFIIISDIVPVEKRGLFMSLTGGAFSFAYTVGPLLGGFFVDYMNWRWIFYINIPIIIITVAIMMFLLPLKSQTENMRLKLQRIDCLGTILFIAGIILFVLGLNWGGKEYAWNSLPVILSLCLACVLLFSFVVVECHFAKEPVIPLKVFNHNVILCSINSFCIGITFFGFLYHWPTYYQKVHNFSGTQAGIELISFLLGVNVVIAISGFIVSYTRSYHYMMIFGKIILMIGIIMMYRLPKMNQFEQIFYPLVIGSGIGFNLQNNIVAGQLSVEKSQMAVITAFLTFCQNVGGVLGLTILGAILNNRANSLLADSTLNAQDTDKPEIVNQQTKEVFNQAYTIMFLSLIPFSVIGLLAVLKLRPASMTPTSSKSS